MKKKVLLGTFTLSLLELFGADHLPNYCYYNAKINDSGEGTKWSDSGWTAWTWDETAGKDVEVKDGSIPNSDSVNVYWQHSQYGIIVDGSYTVARLFANSSMSSSTGKMYVEMADTYIDGSEIKNGTLNLVGDKSFDAGAPCGLNSSNYYHAMNYSFGAGDVERSITFNSGTLNVSDSNNRTAVFSIYSTNRNVSLNFDNGNILNVKGIDLILTSGGSKMQTSFNMNGTVNIGTFDSSTEKWTYDKNLVIGNNNTYTTSNANGNKSIQLKVAQGATINAGGLYVTPNTTVDVNGTLALAGNSTSKFGGIRIGVDIAGTALTSNDKTATLNLNAGSSTTTGFINGGTGVELNIDGAVKINSHRGGNSIYIKEGSITFGENSSLVGPSYATSSQIRYAGILTSNAKKGKIQVKYTNLEALSGVIRMEKITVNTAEMQNTKLVLNTTDAFYYSSTIGQEGIYISGYASNATYDIDVNASQNFKGILFEAKNVTINLDLLGLTNGDDYFNLTSLSNGTLTEENGANLVIDGFKENTIHISSWNELDDFSRISSKNGDWVDFGIDANGYLTATYIPEPSFYAVCAGLLSLATVIYRRRK